jgi:ComF family protein
VFSIEFMSAFEDLLNLLLPTRCALCSTMGAPICSGCLGKLDWRPRVIRREGLEGAIAADYGPHQRTLIKAFKENGQTSLASYLARPMVPLLKTVAIEASSPLLVPIPSSRANHLKRGFSPAKVLAKKLNGLAGRTGRVLDGLFFNRIVQDQSQLDSEARALNLAGSMTGEVWLDGRSVILVDDIVTTGATILEAARAVTEVGGRVIGFLAFAETILKTQSKT